MSRSYRKSPCGGLTTARSDKPFKEEASRRVRHTNKQIVHEIIKDLDLADGIHFPENMELTNQYDAPKDGKVWWDTQIRNDRLMKDWYKKVMRK